MQELYVKELVIHKLQIKFFFKNQWKVIHNKFDRKIIKGFHIKKIKKLFLQHFEEKVNEIRKYLPWLSRTPGHLNYASVASWDIWSVMLGYDNQRTDVAVALDLISHLHLISLYLVPLDQ